MTRITLKSNQDGPLRANREIPAAILKSWLRQIWDRLPEALVSLLAIATFGTLFFHVFTDIFSPDIARLAPAVTQGTTTAATLFTLLLGGVVVYRFSRSDVSLGWDAFTRDALIICEVTGKIMFFIRILVAIIIATAIATILRLSGLWQLVGAQTTASSFMLLAACLAGYASLAAMAGGSATADNRAKPNRVERFLQKIPLTSKDGRRGLMPPLVRWRLGLLLRSPLTWLFLGSGAAMVGVLYLAAKASIPTPFLAILAWLAGWFVCLTQAFQAASEMDSLDFEKGLGITHSEVAKSYFGVAIFTTLVTGLVATTAYFGAYFGANLGTGQATATASVAATATIAPVAMIPGTLMPCLLWQIDARRPIVQVLTSLMSSLFLATAVIASKAALLLWPVVLIYLFKQQSERINQLETKRTSLIKKSSTSIESTLGVRPNVTIDQLTVSLGDRKSDEKAFELGPITLQLQGGACMAVLGPNGSGKSTFFKTITGNLLPSTGTVSIIPENQPSSRQIGYLPQQNHLPSWATPRELCHFTAALSGSPEQLITRALTYWDCAGFETLPTAKLSTGMRKRVGLAIATINNPAILILDEPFEALDLGHIAALKQEISRRRAAGLITIFATHIASYASELANSAFFFNGGKVSPIEWPDNIDARNRLVETMFHQVAPPPSSALHDQGSP